MKETEVQGDETLQQEGFVGDTLQEGWLVDGIVYPEILDMIDKTGKKAVVYDNIGKRLISTEADLVDQYDRQGYDSITLTYLLKPAVRESREFFGRRISEFLKLKRAEIDKYNERYGPEMQVKFGVSIDTSFENRYRGIYPWKHIDEFADVLLLRHVHSKEKIARARGAVYDQFHEMDKIKEMMEGVQQHNSEEGELAEKVRRMAELAKEKTIQNLKGLYLEILSKPVFSYLDVLEIRKHMPNVEILVEHGVRESIGPNGYVRQIPEGLDDALRGMAEVDYLHLKSKEADEIVAMARLKSEITGESFEEALLNPILDQALYDGVAPEELAKAYAGNDISVVLPFVQVEAYSEGYWEDNRITDFFLGGLDFSEVFQKHNVRLVPCSKYPLKGKGISYQVTSRLKTLKERWNYNL